jgi:regulator of nonsense transcripts 2
LIYGATDVFPVDGSLDSSLKKNTAFIRRLRTAIAGPGTGTFLQEIRTLSLHKYLSEIISACAEGLSRLKIPADIAAGVEIFSALHQRFGPAEFTGYVAWHIGRGLSSPDKAYLKTLSSELREKEEKERISRHRVLLRVATELWLVGALKTLDDVIIPEEVAGKGKENTKPSGGTGLKSGGSVDNNHSGQAEPYPLEILKELTAQDAQHANLPMLVQFVKTFAWDLLGTKLQGSEDDNGVGDDAPLLDSTVQQRFKNVLLAYFDGGVAHLKKDQAGLSNQSKRNAEAYVRSGEIFEDRQANYEKQGKALEKFTANMQVLADVLGTDMPDLKGKDASAAATDNMIGLVKTDDFLRTSSDGAGIWEDEDERRFYENIVDLKDRVPGILLEESKKKKADDEQVGRRIDEPAPVKSIEGAVQGEPAALNYGPDSTDLSTAIANRTVGAQVDAILARLPSVSSKEAVDDIAYDFCFVNSKASRNRLVKAVQDIPRGRSDLLPLYSRLVTTLAKYMVDISQGLVNYLDEEFRSLQRRKQKDSLAGVRMSNIRYIAELTKFGLVPEHVIFHCLKVSLDDFSKMNIEVICNLLENCGRYLLRNPETAPRMKSFLEILQRKKAAQHLGQQERMLIENAMYYVNPPERAAIQQKEHTPIDLFVRKLIYVDLTKRNLEKIAKQIRKLHWEEEEVKHVPSGFHHKY